jgi:hypothetical protein
VKRATSPGSNLRRKAVLIVNWFHDNGTKNPEDRCVQGINYSLVGFEFAQISSDILLNGFMNAEQKIMKIKRVQGIKYSPKDYRQGRLTRL